MLKFPDAEARAIAARYRKVGPFNSMMSSDVSLPPESYCKRSRFDVGAYAVSQRCIGRLRAILAALIIRWVGDIAMSEEAREAAGVSAWAPRDEVRAFYSGHSLSDGVPEVVEQIASSLGHRLDFETQVLGYSLLRQRTKGEVASATEWPGYRAGHNRKGAGLNVAEELRQPRRLAIRRQVRCSRRHGASRPPRHRAQGTYRILSDRHGQAPRWRATPTPRYCSIIRGSTSTPMRPWPWIDYERAVLPMWECVASRANLDLPARGNAPRVRVLPGAGALAELAAALWDGKVPGVAGNLPGERVRLLFSDNVHMSEAGRYFIALVHYAVLFGRNPEGAAIPASLAPETGRYMQTLAWQYAVSYGQRANAAARRDMATCRDLMQKEVCPAYAAFQTKGLPVLATLKRQFNAYRCGREYADANDPDKPIRFTQAIRGVAVLARIRCQAPTARP